MEKINDKIQYLKNFIKDDSTMSLVFLSQIKKISEGVSIMFEAINKKFTEKIESARKKIQLEIDQRTNSYSNSITSSGGQTSLIMKKLDSKMRMDVDRLNERKHELEQIVKVSGQLLRLSQDMRVEAGKQGRVINSIENHIIISNVMTGEANEQLTRRRETQTFNIKFYFWICSMLSFILLIVIFYVYWNYFKTNDF
jgi:t-SNARE complex subunit (syntaxin)